MRLQWNNPWANTCEEIIIIGLNMKGAFQALGGLFKNLLDDATWQGFKL
jgi:hypothetical protein